MRNATGIILCLACAGILGGCARGRQSYAWTNLHAGEASLAGVRVQQLPDCQGEHDRFEGKHPAMILYVFRDGRVHQTGFEPDGTRDEDFWFTIKPDSYLWTTMDASYGGNPPDASSGERSAPVAPAG